MEYSNILVETQDNIAVVTINRPKALNALNKDVFTELEDFFYESDHSKFSGVVLSGAGDKAFVAGADIKEFTALDQASAAAMSQRGHKLLGFIESLAKPVVAAVNGFALGAGCELAMACHLRVAGAKAKFGLPEVNLGIIPGYGGTQRLIQLIGKGKALELMLTTDMINADEAKMLGLANDVVEPGSEITKSRKIIQKIATKGPLAVAAIIETANACFAKDKDGFAEETRLFGTLGATNDFKEGAAAFIEKRKPTWKNS